MRGVNGDSRASNSALATINAAASAIASAENRGTQQTVQKRRFGGCWSIYWCFGSYKHKKRIGHAVLVPETTASQADPPPPSNPNQAPSNLIVLPFIAPPSSPASFLQSEPPSMIQSPTGILSFTSASMYSPGPASIFAIGPYAHETQLVSPPVFSTFTTEPSTAPFTPPPESVHLTTPSSPEVPFALMLEGETGQRFPFSYCEFQSYHLQPGSPVGQLISPSSGISGSGTSSPFPDTKVLNLDGLSNHDWGLRQGSGSLTPDPAKPNSTSGFLLNCKISEAPSHQNPENGSKNDHTFASRVSFELTTETAPRKDEEAEDQRHQKNRSITLGSIKEFNFDNVDRDDFPKPMKVAGKEVGDTKNWAFFPMIEPGLS